MNQTEIGISRRRRTNRAFFPALFAAIVFLSALACNSGPPEPDGKIYLLAPKSKKVISFPGKEKTRLYFYNMLTQQQRDSCEFQCVRMFYIDKTGQGEAVSSLISGTLDVIPEDGKITATIENMEKFPIKVKVGHK